MHEDAMEKETVPGRGLAELCLAKRGLGPESHEAMVWEAFRDVCLSGRRDWAEFGALSACLAVRLELEDSEVSDRLYMTLVQPCLFLAERGELERARRLYYEDLLRLKREYAI